MIKDVAYYRRKFSRKTKLDKIGLGVSNSAGEAPNKPVLLLSVIELIHRGEIKQNRIYLSSELIATFLKLWSDLEIDRRADIGLPFFHLRTDGFWHFKANPGFEFVESRESKIKLRTFNDIRQAVQYAYLDLELFEILQEPTFRAELTSTLIDSWFSDKTQQLERSLDFNAIEDIQNRLLSTGGKAYQKEEIEQEDEQSTIVRDGAFRRTVILLYEHRCAFCGLQVLNSLGQNIVDGAHIQPFSQFYDDRIDNGLSLCKNHHWAFDRGWFSINDDYTLLVAEDLREESPHARPMREFDGDPILLPTQQSYHPRIEALRWHRQNVFGQEVRAS